MKAKTGLRRLSSVVGSAALSLAVLAGGATAAVAAPQGYGDIDHDRDGSLTVHKFLHQDGTHEGDISVAPEAGDFADPVAGVEFTVYPLLEDGQPLDLSVQENWDDLEDLTPGAACTAPTGFELGTGIVMDPTEADGSSTVNLPVGLYQVCETDAPANIVDRALPFILTIPMPHETGWVYDVHAYPKNGEGVVEKEIEVQEDLGLGSVVRFPVSVPVPTMAQEWTGFAIRDTLDDRLTPVAAEDITVTVDGAALDSSFYEVTVDGQTITMDFTAAGLAWLNEEPNAHVGKEVEVTFAGTIVELGNGTIENQAQFWPNNPDFDPSEQPPLPSNEVKTHWGNLEITKRAAGTTDAEGTLEGAIFEIYDATNPYGTCDATNAATGNPISIDGETQFTSNENGVVSLAGLFVSDSQNPVIDANERCYVLKEVAAPAGYVLPQGDDAYTPVSIIRGETTEDNIDIVNTQQDVPELPLTGAQGQVLLIMLGVGAMAVAIGLVILRRQKAAATK